MSSLTEDQRSSLGFQMADVLWHCSFEGVLCDIKYVSFKIIKYCVLPTKLHCLRKDIVQWNDPTVGNCFTFNHKESINQKYSSNPGSGLGNTIQSYLFRVFDIFQSYLGLKMLFNVSQNEYLPIIFSTALKIFINDQNDVIFPDNEGFSATPAFKSDFAIKYVKKICYHFVQ